jgi:hypothetical protein
MNKGKSSPATTPSKWWPQATKTPAAGVFPGGLSKRCPSGESNANLCVPIPPSRTTTFTPQYHWATGPNRIGASGDRLRAGCCICMVFPLVNALEGEAPILRFPEQQIVT